MVFFSIIILLCSRKPLNSVLGYSCQDYQNILQMGDVDWRSAFRMVCLETVDVFISFIMVCLG
jgi:hypothetical protein